ncbi:MAG: protein phosphatase 2C domain-containing protein [Actinomycetota bacterium]
MLRAQVELAWKTQAGHRHQVEGLENEDAAFTSTEHPVLDALLIVADGMGGHPLPREASSSAVAAARNVLMDPIRFGADADLPSALLTAVQAAQRAVRGLQTGRAGKQPGTTLSIVALVDGQFYVAHVGDGSVFLMREGKALVLAGGEEQRVGNRPAQFLGQDTELEPETRRVKAIVGDRLLLCTDGLTRYFNDAGQESLAQVLGRQGVRIQAIANQLVAHSRPDTYDDDTTVAVVEVVSFATAPTRPAPPTPHRDGATSMSSPGQLNRRGSVMPLLLSGAIFGGALLAAGFAAGYWVAGSKAAALGAARAASPGDPVEPASAADLQHLPAGNLVLLDALGNRVYALATRPNPPAKEPMDLRAYRFGADGRLSDAGRFRFNPAVNELTDAAGRTYPVQWDESQAALRVVRGGTLTVNTRPVGATVSVNGRTVGPAPLKLTLAAGRHHVRVTGARWSSESEIDVPAGRAVSVTLGPQ